MRRIAVTGYGIVSSIGNNVAEVTDSLKEGRSGLAYSEEYKELGFRSHVYGPVKLDLEAEIHRKVRRFMGQGAGYCYLAMNEAIEKAGLDESVISDHKTGLVVGIGGSSVYDLVEAVDTLRNRGHRKVGPYYVPRSMASGIAANLATVFKIKGMSYCMSSACATSSTCIGHASELIQMGKQDVVFAGGGDEIYWADTMLFDAMGALSSKYNDTPEKASRTYDANRDGFAISGGGGIMVLEAMDHAIARGATIYGELVGYGATSDGENMVAPSGEGATRCMKQCLETVNAPIDYINTHGTSTPVGDITELKAIGEAFGDAAKDIKIASTKSLSGHALGAAGVNEAIYSLIMMEHNFIAASANIETLDPETEGYQIVQERIDNAELNTIMSNSFGFGGANATLAFARYKG